MVYSVISDFKSLTIVQKEDTSVKTYYTISKKNLSNHNESKYIYELYVLPSGKFNTFMHFVGKVVFKGHFANKRY